MTKSPKDWDSTALLLRRATTLCCPNLWGIWSPGSLTGSKMLSSLFFRTIQNFCSLGFFWDSTAVFSGKGTSFSKGRLGPSPSATTKATRPGHLLNGRMTKVALNQHREHWRKYLKRDGHLAHLFVSRRKLPQTITTHGASAAHQKLDRALLPISF